MSAVEDLRIALLDAVNDALPRVQTEDGEWTVKGFIDVFKNIYTISTDTKVISKVLELMLFPVLTELARQNNPQSVLAAEQNHYPDYSLDT